MTAAVQARANASANSAASGAASAAVSAAKKPAAPAPPREPDPAVSVCFNVSIDVDKGQAPLGVFNSCEGLGFEIVIEQREEGGNNSMVWQLPTRMKYSNIKLSRPIGPDSAKLTKWFAGMVNGVKPRTMVIQAMSLDGKVVASWSLQGVIPVRWTGPSMNFDSPKVATETLEVAHHGLLPGGA